MGILPSSHFHPFHVLHSAFRLLTATTTVSVSFLLIPTPLSLNRLLSSAARAPLAASYQLSAANLQLVEAVEDLDSVSDRNPHSHEVSCLHQTKHFDRNLHTHTHTRARAHTLKTKDQGGRTTDQSPTHFFCSRHAMPHSLCISAPLHLCVTRHTSYVIRHAPQYLFLPEQSRVLC